MSVSKSSSGRSDSGCISVLGLGSGLWLKVGRGETELSKCDSVGVPVIQRLACLLPEADGGAGALWQVMLGVLARQGQGSLWWKLGTG